MLASLFVPGAFIGSATALTSGDYEYELINGDTEVKITRYLGSDADVVIPDTIEGKPVATIDWHAFYQIESVESVTIPSSTSYVSAKAFQECWNMTAIYVNASNTHLASLDGVLYTHDLKSIIIYPPGREGAYEVPSTTESIGYEAFAYCDKITSITIPDSVTNIQQRAFYSCGSLSSVTLGSGISVIDQWTFAYCDSLTSITIPDSVTSIGSSAFISCASLVSVTIGSGVTSIGNNAFYYCSSITALDIPANVHTIGGGAFFGLSSLTSLTLNEGLVTIGDYAFISCTSLPTVEIPGSVTSIGDTTFANCRSMTAIEVDPANSVYESVGGVLFTEDMTKLIKFPGGLDGNYTVPDSVTSLGSRAFNACPLVNEVNIGAGVVDIPPFALSYSQNMTAIVVDAANPVFSSVDGVLFDKDVTVLIQYPCGKAGDYVIPSTVVTLGDWSMDYAQKLTEVTVPEGVTHIGEGVFSECPLLTAVNIPASVTFVGEWAFDDCPALLEINVNEGNLNYSSADGVLFNANGTILIKYPSGRMGAYEVPEGVEEIGEWAFDDCTGLTSIVIPSSVRYLGQHSFDNLHALQVIRFEGNAPDRDINWLSSPSASLVIQYYQGAANFTSLTWLDIPLVALSVPGVPVLVSATADDTAVTLTWTAPENDGNLSITGYKVFYGTTSPDAQFGGTLSNTSTTVAVTGLDPGTKYYFAVRAVNELGESPMSNVMNATVPSEDEGTGGEMLMIATVAVVVVAAAAVAVWWFKFRK